MALFNKACLEIPSLNVGVVIEAIKQGVLLNRAFFDSISKVKNVTLDQIRKKAQKYIRQEETRSSKKDNDIKIESTRSEFTH